MKKTHTKKTILQKKSKKAKQPLFLRNPSNLRKTSYLGYFSPILRITAAKIIDFALKSQINLSIMSSVMVKMDVTQEQMPLSTSPQSVTEVMLSLSLSTTPE